MHLDKTLFLTLALLAAGPALAQPKPAPSMGSHAGMASGPAAASPDASMMDSMAKMNQAMSSAPMTGDPDHDFVAMMIPHHQGAIDMANFELQHGKDPTLRKLAHDVVTAQDKEIAVMKGWLAKHPAK